MRRALIDETAWESMAIVWEANQKLLVRGKHVSAIAFMSVCGMLDLKIVEGVDSNTFCDFVDQVLLPHLMPFDGHIVLSLCQQASAS